MNRRVFLLISIFSLLKIKDTKASKKKENKILYTAYSDYGNFFFGAFHVNGKLKYKVELDHRAHDLALINSINQICLVSRRPNNKLTIIDLNQGKVKQEIIAPAGRHFYGHAAYNVFSKLLYVTENNYKYNDNRAGVIAIYDPFNSYKRVGEINSNGIGPHEIKINSIGNIVIANGGILTHPDYPRIKLNLTNINSNISIIDSNSGRLINVLQLHKSLKSNSIRHLDLDEEDNLFFACQNYSNNNKKQLPLIFSYYNKKISNFSVPYNIYKNIKNYSGSIKVSNLRNLIYVSFPKGNKVLIWDKNNFNFKSVVDIDDGCGIAVDGKNDQTYFSNGLGNIFYLEGNKRNKLLFSSNYQFDNHLSINSLSL